MSAPATSTRIGPLRTICGTKIGKFSVLYKFFWEHSKKFVFKRIARRKWQRLC